MGLVLQRCKDTECQHVNGPNCSELFRATGRLLQLPGASCSCAICAQLLVSTDVQSYPVSYTLVEVLELLRDHASNDCFRDAALQAH